MHFPTRPRTKRMAFSVMRAYPQRAPTPGLHSLTSRAGVSATILKACRCYTSQRCSSSYARYKPTTYTVA